MPLSTTRINRKISVLWSRLGRSANAWMAAFVMVAVALLMPTPADAKVRKAAAAPAAAKGKPQAKAQAKLGKVARAAVAAKPGSRVRLESPTASRSVAKRAVSSRLTAKAGRTSVTASGRHIQGPGLRVDKRHARRSIVKLEPPKPSFGQLYGLHATGDELELRSSVALVVDQDTGEVLFSKNPQAVLPIASITKLMTALVVTQAALPLDELLTVDPEDVQATLGNKSRLREGTQLTRGEMLHLSLMASENRAAHVLGRTYPGGMKRFVSDMNSTARTLGMSRTSYVEPTGLSDANQSSAQDLTRLVKAASLHPVIRELSTSLEMVVAMGEKSVQFRNTNGLVRNPEWEIGLQKTGYISAAGRCLVMQAQMAGRKLIMVLLDSTGKYSRMGDAERLRNWLVGADSGLVSTK